MAVIEADVTTMQVAAATQMGFDYSQIDEGIRDEVKAAARSIHQLERGVVTGIVAIGKRLLEVKGMIPHGQFCDWLVGEFGLEPRMAQNMMNVAREFGDPQKRNTVSFFSPSVLYVLAAPSTPEVLREAVIEQAQVTGKPPTRAEVKRLRDEQRPKPTPPASKVVYTEPTPVDFPPMPHDLDARGFEFCRVGDRMWAIYRAEDTYQSNWHFEPNDCIADVREYLDDEQAALDAVAAETAQEDAERAARDAQRPSFDRVPEPTMIRPEWVSHTLARANPISADFKTALDLATLEQLNAAFDGCAFDKDGDARSMAIAEKRAPLVVAALQSEPDPRIEQAQTVINALTFARNVARADYGRLTDRYTDLLPFDRAVEDMLPHLQSLIDTLEGRK